MELENKVIVVTGAARGLGAATAVRLAEQGARLALVDLDTGHLADTERACAEVGPEPQCFAADVSCEEDVVDLFNHVVADFGRIDGLVNNAGITRDALLVKARDGVVVSKMSLSQWQAVIDVNLTGVFLCGREAAARMIECGTPGVIVNICSISRHGNMGQTNYTAAKAGVAAMTVTWAKELARYGIRVASIAPGFMATELVATMKPEARQKITNQIPLQRLGQPEEIAGTVEFIFKNDYFSGRCIEPDGGLRL